MFGFSSLRCVDCEYIDPSDKNRSGEAYCAMEKKYVSLDSYTCGYFKPNFYVMTAYCDINKLPYECNAMTTLIGFRDTYMMNNEEGKEFLREYEDIGPILAVKLISDMYRTDIVDEMEEKYINPTIEFINEERCEDAQATYIEMIEMLKTRYGYAPIKGDKTKRL